MQALNLWSYFSSSSSSPSSAAVAAANNRSNFSTSNEYGQSTICLPQEGPPTKKAKVMTSTTTGPTTAAVTTTPSPAAPVAIAPRPNVGNTTNITSAQWASIQQQRQQQQQQQFNPILLNGINLDQQAQQQQAQAQQHAYPFGVISAAAALSMKGAMASPSSSPSNPIEDLNDKKRKQINAMHAKKARERKKNLMATLELEQLALQEENRRLRALVKEHIPDRAQTIIGECSYKPRGKGLFHGASSSKLTSTDFDLIETLTVSKQSFVLTNPRLPDNPIVYASCSFLNMTGYTRDQVIGRNCRFLQGIQTNHETVDKVREATKSGNDVSVNLLNYKADGTPFWNHLFIAALRDKEGNIVNYVGVQSEIENPNNTNASNKKDGDASDDDDDTKDIIPAPPPQIEKIKSVFSTATTTTQTTTSSSKAIGTNTMSTTKGKRNIDNNHITTTTTTSTALDMAKCCPGSVMSSESNEKKLQQENDKSNHHNTNHDPIDLKAAMMANTTAATSATDTIITDHESALDWVHLAEVLEFDFDEVDEAEWRKNNTNNGGVGSSSYGDMDDSIDASFFDCIDDYSSTNKAATGTTTGGQAGGMDESMNSMTATTTATTNTTSTGSNTNDGTCTPGLEDIHNAQSLSTLASPSTEETMLYRFCQSPRQFVLRTLRSELIDSLMSTHGDVTDPRFASALDVLSSMFKSTCHENTSMSSVLNGSWKSISRPSFHHGGCLGKNDNDEFVYTLGKMTFNMFKPGNLRCTVQHTMNTIEPVCKMDKHPNAAPWSLRRELALANDNGSISTQQNTMLKSYDISIALTIEPGQFEAKNNEVIPSPPRRLRALQTVHGYFLPDPDTPNRLTVWFTGGQLSPVPPPQPDSATGKTVKMCNEYGGLEEWIALFGAEHKKTWGESLSNLGAQLFLGAELPAGMEKDGSMAYALHRPFGGHGKGYVDVLYVDDELLITQGNSNTVHVMTTQNIPGPK